MAESDPRIESNAAIVPAGVSGGIATFVAASANFVLDINGYFAP
jgi:hypothetical protein